MARIVQIRRGTAAQNDNFTGMQGEVTMDTTNKTLRVHDGETLGGFALARADNVAQSGGMADIKDVPDEFWTQLFAKMMPPVIKYTDGNTMPIGTTTYLEYVFNIDTTVLVAQPMLVCVNDDAGYAVNDTILSFGIGANPVMSPNLYSDKYGMHVRLFIGGESFWVPHKATGVKTNISPDNWRIKFRVYY